MDSVQHPLGPCSKCGSPRKFRGKDKQVYCPACFAKYRKKRHEQGIGVLTPKQRQAANYRKNYDLTIEEYNDLLYLQNGVCAVCGEKETRKLRGKVIPLAVDHCHDTGTVRGLLCSDCNNALGFLREDITRTMRMLDYIRRKQEPY
jgi:hypothetical protein